MEMIKVESSTITRAGYDNKDLIVEYRSGAQYKYFDVPDVEVYQFFKADSKGKYLNENIKGKYKYQKLEEKLN